MSECTGSLESILSPFLDLLWALWTYYTANKKNDNNTSLGYENKCQVFESRLTSLSDGWPLWWQAAKLSRNQSGGLSGSWNHHPSTWDDACSDCDYLTTMHVDALDKLGIHKAHTGSIPSPLLSSSARLRYWTTVWRGGSAPYTLSFRGHVCNGPYSKQGVDDT